MHKQFFLFLFLTLVVLSCTRCKEECTDSSNPDCPNYVAHNPCEGLTPTTADFITYQHTAYFTGWDTLVEFHQHCLWGGAITLRAMQDDAEYHWVIGAEHYYTREVTFQFGAEFEGQNIPLKLTVTRTPNSQCFPNDTGTTTKTKIVTPRSQCNSAIYGKYYGSWEDNPSDSFTLEFMYDSNGGGALCDDLLLIVGAKPNFPDTCISINSIRINNYLEFGGSATDCYNPIGKAFLDSTLNNILIDYTITETPESELIREYHIFRGYRVN